MNWRHIVKTRSFWMLLGINVALVVYYLHYHTGLKTLLWIYWCQSALIGLFNFLALVTMESVQPGSITINDQPVKSAGQARGCLGGFFALHYGIFHFVYLIFLFTITDPNERLDFGLFEASVGAFFLDQLWNFIQLKRWGRTHATNAGVMFFLPYARILPMHLTILLPKFLGLGAMAVFLPLKVFADMLMFVLTAKFYGLPQDEPDPQVLG